MTAPQPLAGQVTLITGASQGLGQAIAHHLAAVGMHLVLSARTQTKLEAVAQAIRQAYPQCQVLTLPADMRDPVQVLGRCHPSTFPEN
jgi:short-subunit dehydrogenase